MTRHHRGARSAVQSRSPSPQGPSQRQLRAGELVRHALVEILREGDLHDAALEGGSVTVTEVRLSPDFKHAVCFVEPLGAGLARSGPAAKVGGAQAQEVIKALNRHAKFLRGKLGRHIDLKFTPELRFLHDDSFDAAQRMDALLNRPEVRRDLASPSAEEASDQAPPPAAPAPPSGEGDR